MKTQRQALQYWNKFAFRNASKKRRGDYPVPLITMSTLKFVMPLMPDDTLKLNVAVAIPFAASKVLSLSHVTVIGPFAAPGFQFAFVILSVTCAVPVFLTYIVRVVKPPGAIDPQAMLVKGKVQPGSE
jgi:hypothetical protein